MSGRSLASAAKTARSAAAAFDARTKSVSSPPPPERKEIQRKQNAHSKKKKEGGRGILLLLKEGHRREEGAVVQWSVCRWGDTRGRQPPRMRDDGGGPGEGPGERRSTPKHEHRVPSSLLFCYLRPSQSSTTALWWRSRSLFRSVFIFFIYFSLFFFVRAVEWGKFFLGECAKCPIAMFFLSLVREYPWLYPSLFRSSSSCAWQGERKRAFRPRASWHTWRAFPRCPFAQHLGLWGGVGPKHGERPLLCYRPLPRRERAAFDPDPRWHEHERS